MPPPPTPPPRAELSKLCRHTAGEHSETRISVNKVASPDHLTCAMKMTIQTGTVMQRMQLIVTLLKMQQQQQQWHIKAGIMNSESAVHMLSYDVNGDDIRCLLLPHYQFLHPLVPPHHLCQGSYLAAFHPLQKECIILGSKSNSRSGRSSKGNVLLHRQAGLLRRAVPSNHCRFSHK